MVQERERLAVGVNEAAQILGVGRDLVYRLIMAGDLPSFAIGHRRLIATADLREFVDRQSAEATRTAEPAPA